jgi:hypothetical protein
LSHFDTFDTIILPSGLFYKYITIVNEDVSDAPSCVITYDHN